MYDAVMENAPAEQEHGAQDDATEHRAVHEQYNATLADVTNADFLRAVFGSDLDDALPIIVAFKGNPNGVAKSAWFGQPWRDGPAGASDCNGYFSLATFTANEKGQYRRQKAQFAALHCVVLDDIGTRVSLARELPEASWWLGTSPGNYQVGYLLDEPLTDSAMADRLMKAIIAAGLCDPGAGGPCARLVRLPVGVNGKHTPPFECRLTEWHPERRYSVQRLVAALQIELVESRTERSQRVSNRPAQAAPEDGDDVLLPRPHENPVIAALRERGLYKAALGGGRHDITCPWAATHTDGADNGSAYFEPSDLFPLGGFKCHHGHCIDAKRHISDLLDHLGVERTAARMRPTIRLLRGELARTVDAAERALASTGRFYEHGGGVGQIVTARETGAVSVHRHDATSLAVALSSAVTFERYDMREKDYVRADPPERHVAALVGKPSYVHLPLLRGLAHQPYLREDGTLATRAGYDRASGMYGVFDPAQYSVPDAPDTSAARASLELLLELVDEFEFIAENDRAAALCGMLTAAVRPSLTTAPMFHVRAHSIASGKTYLTEIMALFASAQRIGVTTFPGKDEEMAKMLIAELRASPPAIIFDNLTGDILAHKSLCAVLTSASGLFGQRELGVMKKNTVNTRSLILSSGNNVGPVADMARRVVTVNIDSPTEIPGTRTFKRDMLQELEHARGRYVSAALTIVRAWLAAGSPAPSGHAALQSFTLWDGLCRQPLMWLGLSDPITSTREAIIEDPDRQRLGALLTAWDACFGRRATKVREAASMFGDTPAASDLHEILLDLAEERGSVNPEVLGRWIKRHAGQRVNGLKFVEAEKAQGVARWRVEKAA